MGNHLKYCPERAGRDYQAYLSKRTLSKKAKHAKKEPCSNCGRLFSRLDTHLRNSAQCRKPSSEGLDLRQLPSSQELTDMPSSDTPQEESHSYIPEEHQQSQTCEEQQLRLEMGTHQPELSQQNVPPVDIPTDVSPKKPFVCPMSGDEWQAADEHMAKTVVPQVLAARSVEEKNRVLCCGVYSYFSTTFGTFSHKGGKRKRSKRINQSITVLRNERNRARQQLRKAKENSKDPHVIRELANRFHQYLRQFNKAQRAEKHRLEESQRVRARKECAKNFWKFATQVLEEEGDKNDVQPTFSAATAEEYFSTTYSNQLKTFQ